MLRRLKENAALTAVRVIAGFLCAFGIAAGVCGALFPAVDYVLLAVLCGGAAVLFSVACAATDYWGLLFIPAVGVLIWAGAGGGPLAGAFRGVSAMLQYPQMGHEVLLLYRGEFTLAIGASAAVLCAAICLLDSPLLMGLAAVIALLPSYLTAPSLPLWWTALPAAGILLMVARARSGRARLGAAAVTAALVALSLIIVPPKAPSSETLRQGAEKAYEVLEAYLPARDSGYRQGYSLRGDGYLPRADEFNDLMGGRAQPENAPVMEVWTDQTVYLRASPRNAYTGVSWQDTLSYQRYLYINVLQQNERKRVLNQEIPKGAEEEALAEVRVRMTRDAATTLYVPDRMQELTPDSPSMVPYYNAASEVFLSRNLQAGDSYTVRYLPVLADRSRTKEWVRRAASEEDPDYAEILEKYLTVPDFVRLNSAVTELSFQAAGGQEDLLARAISIRNWLRESFPYTLDVSDPPPNTDFVSWFLLREKKGYCTYFATAMTLLCRLQGIPARFVAGYLVQPDESGYTVVTGKMGHAWTEVYLKGFGWLTLDATPGNEETVWDDDPRQNGGNELPDPPQDEETPRPDRATPTPAPSEIPDEEGEPEGEAFQTPSPAPSPGPTDPPPGRTKPKGGTFSWLWALLILPAAALTRLLICLFRTEPVRAARRQPQRGALILYTALEEGLTATGHGRNPGETLDEYVHRIQPYYPNIPLTKAFASYSGEVYGEHPMSLSLFVGAWEALRQAMSPLERMQVRLRLMKEDRKKRREKPGGKLPSREKERINLRKRK